MLSEEKINSLIGNKCGKLTIVEFDGYYAKEGNNKTLYWYKCVCDCGNTVIVDKTHLNPNNGRATKSCGCSRNVHGMSKNPIYTTYKGMMQRVHHPHPYYHKHYIENNISICEEWDGHPEVFIKWAKENGWKEGLTLDRIDNLGDYTPNNCRFTTPTVQANNRSSYNHNLTFNGKTQSTSMWAKELGMAESTLRCRINDLGMSVEEALTTPVDKRFSTNKKKSK